MCLLLLFSLRLHVCVCVCVPVLEGWQKSSSDGLQLCLALTEDARRGKCFPYELENTQGQSRQHRPFLTDGVPSFKCILQALTLSPFPLQLPHSDSPKGTFFPFYALLSSSSLSLCNPFCSISILVCSTIGYIQLLYRQQKSICWSDHYNAALLQYTSKILLSVLINNLFKFKFACMWGEITEVSLHVFLSLNTAVSESGFLFFQNLILFFFNNAWLFKEQLWVNLQKCVVKI